MVEFLKSQQLEVQTKFVLVLHPQANGKGESNKKVFLNGIKMKVDDTKDMWVKELH